MTQYRAVFLTVDGLSETHFDPTYGLAAINREEAEAEARLLPIPEGANFIKLFLRGRYQAPPVGFDPDARMPLKA